MTKKTLHSLIVGALCLAASATDARAEDYFGRTQSIRERLEMSRQLVRRFELQYLQLSKKNTYDPSPELLKKMSVLKQKLSIVSEDRDELLRELPENMQAREFLKDAVARQPVFELKRALAAAKKDTALLHEKALKLTESKQFSQAIKTYQDILLIDPQDDQAYLIMGHLYLMSGRVQDAEKSFFNAIDIEPSDKNDILPFYENLVLQNPDDTYYTFLGFACLIVGDAVRAKEAFKEALLINPANEKAQSGMKFFNRPQ